MDQSGGTLTQIAQLIGCFSSTAIAVFLASLHNRPLIKRQQILEFAVKQSFNARVVVLQEVSEENQL